MCGVWYSRDRNGSTCASCLVPGAAGPEEVSVSDALCIRDGSLRAGTAYELLRHLLRSRVKRGSARAARRARPKAAQARAAGPRCLASRDGSLTPEGFLKSGTGFSVSVRISCTVEYTLILQCLTNKKEIRMDTLKMDAHPGVTEIRMDTRRRIEFYRSGPLCIRNRIRLASIFPVSSGVESLKPPHLRESFPSPATPSWPCRRSVPVCRRWSSPSPGRRC